MASDSTLSYPFICNVCQQFASRTYPKLLRHIGTVHSFDPHFKLTCGLDGCPRTYTKYRSFQKHVTRHHKHVLSSQTRGSITTNVMPNTEAEKSFFDSYEYTAEWDSHSQTNDEVEEDTPLHSSSHVTALFLLIAKECLKVSQNSIDSLLDVNNLCQGQVRKMKLTVCKLLSENHIQGVEKIFKDGEDIDIFNGLHYVYLQNKYFRDQLGLVVSFSINMYVLFIF